MLFIYNFLTNIHTLTPTILCLSLWPRPVQLLVSALALQSKADTPTLITLAGNMVLFVICELIGAMTVAPYKFMWWVASLIFLGLVFMVLIQRLSNPEGYGGESLKVCSNFPTCLVYAHQGSALIFSVIFISGSFRIKAFAVAGITTHTRYVVLLFASFSGLQLMSSG